MQMSSSSPHLKLQVDQVKHRQHEHEHGADDLDNGVGRQRARRLLLGQVHLLDCAATLLCSTKVKRKCLSRQVRLVLLLLNLQALVAVVGQENSMQSTLKQMLQNAIFGVK